jgi:hypothetical protein
MDFIIDAYCISTVLSSYVRAPSPIQAEGVMRDAVHRDGYTILFLRTREIKEIPGDCVYHDSNGLQSPNVCV